jgi:superfamily II DNA or RNA helicase
MFELRPYQRQASDACYEDLSSNRKCLLVLPTGAGKTEIFIDIASRYVKENSGKAVLILSHLSILTDQTKERIKLRSPELRVGLLKHNVRPDHSDDVIIGTMQTSRNQVRTDWLNNRLLKEIGLIIVDEAHYIWTQSYLKILGYYPNAKVIGCTATPFRQNKLMTNFFDKVSYNISVQELIDQGYLVKPRLITIERISDETKDIMAQIVSTYKTFEMGQKAIVFMQRVRDAKDLAVIFRESGVNAANITSDTAGNLRDASISGFNRGDTAVLTTCDLLSAGFDAPACSVIFQPYETTSTTKYIQRMGRGLRPNPGTNKTECRIYVYGTLPKIQNEYYHRLQNLSLNQNGIYKNYETHLEEIEYNDELPGNPTFEYNLMVKEALDKMEKLDMPVLSKLLNNKAFPSRFTSKIKTFIERLPNKKSAIPHRDKVATEAQISYLASFHFDKSQIQGISRGEAHEMIKTIKGPPKGEFVLPSGRFKDFHVTETPYSYRQYILTTFPDSEIASIIRKWNSIRSIA